MLAARALKERLQCLNEAPSWAKYLPNELQAELHERFQVSVDMNVCGTETSLPSEPLPDSELLPRVERAWWYERVWVLSRDDAGCREIQEAVDLASCDEEIVAIAAEMRGHVAEAVRCPNANYVMQKLIERLPSREVVFIFEELMKKGPDSVVHLARHRYGCRILQRMLKVDLPEYVTYLIDKLLTDAFATCTHPFGNYVMQRVLEEGSPHAQKCLVDILSKHVPEARPDTHTMAVYVKAFATCQKEARATLARAMLNAPELLSKMVAQMQGHQAARLRQMLKALRGAEHDQAQRPFFGRQATPRRGGAGDASHQQASSSGDLVP